MYFLQAAQTPVTVKLGDRTLTIPKYELSEVMIWADEIEKSRTEELTAGLDDIKAREWKAYYPPIPPDMAEMKRMLRTIPAIQRVCRTCLLNATVTGPNGQNLPKLMDADVEALFKSNGTGRLAGLAWVLADLTDDSLSSDPSVKEGADDPLKGTGQPGSTESSTTGASSSTSSQPPTPDATPSGKRSQPLKQPSTTPQGS